MIKFDVEIIVESDSGWFSDERTVSLTHLIELAQETDLKKPENNTVVIRGEGFGFFRTTRCRKIERLLEWEDK